MGADEFSYGSGNCRSAATAFLIITVYRSEIVDFSAVISAESMIRQMPLGLPQVLSIVTVALNGRADLVTCDGR